MVLDALLNAIESGTSLKVRYFGGSSPGSERVLMPLSVKDGKFQAHCLSSGETKTFVVEKTEIIIDGVPSTLTATLPPPVPTCLSVEEFVNRHTTSWADMGWAIQREGESISLHRTRKNGTLIKTPDVALTFSETTYDLLADADGNVFEANHRDRVRPWTLHAKKESTRTFKDFDKAQLAFVQFAEKLAPLSLR